MILCNSLRRQQQNSSRHPQLPATLAVPTPCSYIQSSICEFAQVQEMISVLTDPDAKLTPEERALLMNEVQLATEEVIAAAAAAAEAAAPAPRKGHSARTWDALCSGVHTLREAASKQGRAIGAGAASAGGAALVVLAVAGVVRAARMRQRRRQRQQPIRQRAVSVEDSSAATQTAVSVGTATQTAVSMGATANSPITGTAFVPTVIGGSARVPAPVGASRGGASSTQARYSKATDDADAEADTADSQAVIAGSRTPADDATDVHAAKGRDQAVA